MLSIQASALASRHHSLPWPPFSGDFDEPLHQLLTSCQMPIRETSRNGNPLWPSTCTICISFVGPKKKATSSATSVKSSAPPGLLWPTDGGRYESSQAERQDKQPNLGPQLISCLWLRSAKGDQCSGPWCHSSLSVKTACALSLGVSLRGGNFDFFGSKGTSCIFFSRYLAPAQHPSWL